MIDKQTTILILFMLCVTIAICGCPLNYMQTPETIAQKEVIAGAGLTGTVYGDESHFVPIPGFWARKGITERMDLGVYVFGVGLKLDIKHNFSKYFAIGFGGGASFAFDLIYTAEGSLYGGVPIGALCPYIVVRQHIIGNLNSNNHFFPLATVGGMRVSINRSIAMYFEGGVRFNDFEDNTVHPLGGIGISICGQK